MRVARPGLTARAERLHDGLLLREQAALEPGRIDEHERHVFLGSHGERLAVGDIDDQVVASRRRDRC